MKLAFPILALMALTRMATAAAPETSTEIIVGLSPFQSAAERVRQQALLRQFVVRDCPNGSHVVIWDAWELRVVCDVQLPALRFDSVAARAPRVAPGLVALKQWFAGLEGGPEPDGLKDTGAVKIPEWLHAATAQPATGRRAVVLLASPFCLVPSEPAFSMVETRYPSDGHLGAGDRSLYSIVDKGGRLKDTAVLWSYGTESVWASPNHRAAVSRWWSLFIAGQGPNAMLASFSADAPQVLLAAARSDHRAIAEHAVNPDDAAPVMHRAEQRELPVKLQARPAPAPETVPPPAPAPLPPTRPEVTDESRDRMPATAVEEPPPAPVAEAVVEPSPTASEPEPELATKPEETPETAVSMPLDIPQVGNGRTGIAIIWQVPANASRSTDIDAYVSSGPGEPEVHWRNHRADGIRYYRDVRRAGGSGGDDAWRTSWEFVECEHDDLARISCWLNVYQTRAPVSGMIRVQHRGRIVDHPFHFNVSRGNGGRDSAPTARLRSPYWQKVNLTEFFPSTSVQPSPRSR